MMVPSSVSVARKRRWKSRSTGSKARIVPALGARLELHERIEDRRVRGVGGRCQNETSGPKSFTYTGRYSVARAGTCRTAPG